MGIVANNYGRKRASFLSLLLGSLGVILIGLSNNYWMALISYALSGFSYSCIIFSSVLLNEIGNINFRNLGLGMIWIFWSLAGLGFVGISFLLKQ